MENWLTHIQWIFSGIGVVIIGGIIGWKNKKKKEQIDYQNKKLQYGNNNIQADGNVNINNNIYQTEGLKKKESPISIIASKFYQIFEEHRVNRGQIPSFIDQNFGIKYVDVEDVDSIVPKLNDDLIDWVSKKFGIKRSWFDSIEQDYWHNKLYDSIDCYKQHWKILRLFEELIDEFNPYEYRNYIKVFFLKNFEEFKGDCTEDTGEILIIIEVLIGQTSTGLIYRYILIDNLKWSYKKSRQDVKRIIRIVEKLDIYNVGEDLPKKEFEEISSKKIVPRFILEKFRMVTWYPDDYNGYFNAQIDKTEYEEDKEFKLSLKEIDINTLEMLERKKQEFRDKLK